MDHVLNLYKAAGFQPIKSDGSGTNGPCPFCEGGKDRFIIYHVASGKRKSCQIPECGSYFCRVCGVSGDAITWHLKFLKEPYPQVCEKYGISLNNQPNYRPRRNRRHNQVPSRFSSRRIVWQPRGEGFADFVQQPDQWQEHAEKFVLACHEAVLDRQKSLDYLAARGVTLDLVRLYRIGFNAGQVSKRKGDWQPTYKQAAAWGMPNLRRPRDNSLQKTIALQAGLTIPCYARYGSGGPTGELLRINIRPFFGDYRIVKGSIHFLQTQIIINPGQDVALVVESELDGIALSAILPAVTIICMGSAAGRPGVRTHEELQQKQLILLCLDRDRSTDKDIAGHCKKYPDSPAPVFAFGAGVDRHPEEWFANYPQCQPWYCPAPHKDPGDAILAGIDIAAWFAEGVVYYSVAVPQAVSLSPDMGESRGRGAGAAENLLAFAIFWPEHAGILLDSVKNDADVLSVCRLVVSSGVYAEGLLDATEGDLKDKISRILIAGAHCWDWSADPAAYLRVAKPSSPDCAEWTWLIDYLVRRQIDIKVIEGSVSLVFTRAIGLSAAGELERVSSALLLEEVSGYLGRAKNGIWKAEVFR